MKKVLIIATSRKTRGGITAVINFYKIGEQWHTYHCHWIQTHRDGPNWRKVLYLLCAWCDYLCRLPFCDIVHVHASLRTSVRRKKAFVYLAKVFNKKVIMHLHCGTQINEIWNSDYDYLFRVADASVFLSENLQQMVESHTGKSHKYRVINNPCPIIKLNSNIQKTKTVLFSGTLDKDKGYQDLLRAFAMIAEKYPQWKVRFAGNGEINIGIAIAKELGISEKVEFLGWISGDQKDKVFQETLIFCLPSYAEGFPMSILDAWSYGVPVITTPVGGIPDVAVDGENILLFNPGDIDTLSKQLEKMIVSYETNQELYEKIHEASIDFAENRFNVNMINHQIGELYAEVLNNK